MNLSSKGSLAQSLGPEAESDARMGCLLDSTCALAAHFSSADGESIRPNLATPTPRGLSIGL